MNRSTNSGLAVSESTDATANSARAAPEQIGGLRREYTEQIAELFEREHSKLVHILVAKTRSWAEARDIAAEAFAQVLAKDPKQVSFLQAYLYRAAHNIALNRVTRSALRQKLVESQTADLVSVGVAQGPQPESFWIEQQRLGLLKAALNGLPPRCRMAVALRMWEELSYEEVVARFRAEGIAVNERTVRRWVAYAYEQCREQIRTAEDARRDT